MKVFAKVRYKGFFAPSLFSFFATTVGRFRSVRANVYYVSGFYSHVLK